MILHGGSANRVSTLGREFQLIGLLGVSKDDTIEAFMVVKLGEDREVQPRGIHLGNGCSMVGGSSDAEYSTSFHCLASSADGSMPWLCSLLRLLELKCHRSGTGLAILELACVLGKMVSVLRNPRFLEIHDNKPCC